MTQEDWVFIANVVVIDPMQDIVTSSAISQAESVAMKFNAIAKIYKYRRLHERHHFIPMAMGVHNARGHDMDRFIKECVCLFHNR
jgi:chemotaxis signal transduction protein